MWTEAEAKAKLCPFINHTDVIPDVVTTTRPTLCVASECMAWRWVLTKEQLSPEKEKAAGMARGLAWALQPTTYEHGFCGASGQSSGRPPVTPTSEENAA